MLQSAENGGLGFPRGMDSDGGWGGSETVWDWLSDLVRAKSQPKAFVDPTTRTLSRHRWPTRESTKVAHTHNLLPFIMPPPRVGGRGFFGGVGGQMISAEIEDKTHALITFCLCSSCLDVVVVVVVVFSFFGGLPAWSCSCSLLLRLLPSLILRWEDTHTHTRIPQGRTRTHTETRRTQSAAHGTWHCALDPTWTPREKLWRNVPGNLKNNCIYIIIKSLFTKL